MPKKSRARGLGFSGVKGFCLVQVYHCSGLVKCCSSSELGLAQDLASQPFRV